MQTFVDKVVSLPFNILFRFVITFLPRSKHLLISWLHLLSTVILEPKKRKPVTVSTFSFYLPWSDRTGCHDLSFLGWVLRHLFFPLSPSSGCSLVPLHPCSSNGKESTCNTGDPGLIPGSERSSGEGNGNPFQYSCLEISMDRGAWQAIAHGITESDMTEQLIPLYTTTHFLSVGWYHLHISGVSAYLRCFSRQSWF